MKNVNEHLILQIIQYIILILKSSNLSPYFYFITFSCTFYVLKALVLIIKNKSSFTRTYYYILIVITILFYSHLLYSLICNYYIYYKIFFKVYNIFKIYFSIFYCQFIQFLETIIYFNSTQLHTQLLSFCRLVETSRKSIRSFTNLLFFMV